MDSVVSTPRLPFELRQMIWKHYELSEEPMTHIITSTGVISRGLPKVYGSRVISLPMPDADHMSTVRSLVRVNREVRAAVLRNREVYCFSRSINEMACVYGWKSQSIHERGPTCRLSKYSSLFVNWESDLFYFPYAHDPKDPQSLVQDPRFQANAQHVAFDAVFELSGLKGLLTTGPGTSYKNQNVDSLRSYTQSLAAVRSIRLAIPSDTIKSIDALRCNAIERRQRMKDVKSGQYGFSSPLDASAQFHSSSPLSDPFVRFCQRLETDVARSAGDKIFAFWPSLEGQRSRADGTEPEPTCPRHIEVRVVVDHLGEWDYEFQGYNRATNSAAPPRLV